MSKEDARKEDAEPEKGTPPMSDVLDRLAAKRDDIPGGFAMSKYMNERDRDRAEARWWVEAIAEELNRAADRDMSKAGFYWAAEYLEAVAASPPEQQP